MAQQRFKIGEWVSVDLSDSHGWFSPFRAYVLQNNKFKITNMRDSMRRIELSTPGFGTGNVEIPLENIIKLHSFGIGVNIRVLKEGGKIVYSKNDTFDVLLNNGETLRFKDGLLNGIFQVNYEII